MTFTCAEVGGIRECLRFPNNGEFHPLMYLEVRRIVGEMCFGQNRITLMLCLAEASCTRSCTWRYDEGRKCTQMHGL